MKNFWLLSLLGLMSLSGCKNLPFIDKDSIFSSYVDFGAGKMMPDEDYLFDFFDSIPDVKKLKDVSVEVSVRYTDRCKIKSLPLNVETASLYSDSIELRQIDIPLFNENDEFQGQGNFGIFETNYTLSQLPEIPEGFFVDISTPEKNTRGIISLGISVTSNHPPK